MTNRTELPSPVGYEYRSTGPWLVSMVDTDGSIQARILHTLESAIIIYWNGVADDRYPLRRVMVDALGHPVLGISNEFDRPKMIGTRETMDATLALAAAHLDDTAQIEMLRMVETMRAMDGRAV